jgi:uncharacterized protein (DUF2236 family)
MISVKVCVYVGVWAVYITLCSTLRSREVQQPYQAVMQPVKMLSMVQL